MEYWEYLLNWLYYKKTLKCYSCWVGDSRLYKSIKYNKDEDIVTPMPIVTPTVAMSLNKEGIKQLKKELDG